MEVQWIYILIKAKGWHQPVDEELIMNHLGNEITMVNIEASEMKGI